MNPGPTHFLAALPGLAIAAALAGCAGTEAPTSPSASSSSSSTSSDAAETAAPSAAATQGSTRAELTVVDGPVAQAGRLAAPVGESVTLVLNSEVDDEVHVHGYDLTADLMPGETTELTFDATIPGVFEVELHDAGTLLLRLQIQ